MPEKRNTIKAVLKNIGWLIFDKIFILLMNLIVLFVVANHYGAELYGLFQYATNIVLILEVIVQLIDSRVVKKRYDGNNYDYVIFNVTLAKVFLSTIALFVGLVIMLFARRGEDFNFILIFLLIDSIVKNLRFGMENRFEYLLQSKKVVLASNIGLFIGTGMQLLAVVFDQSVVVLSVIQLCATIISYVVLLYQYRKSFREKSVSTKSKFDYSLIKSVLKESLPLAIASASALIYTRCDSVMLGTMLTTVEVGIYSIASKLISTIQILVVPIQTTIFVKMIEWKKCKEKYEKNYIKISSFATWISIIGVICSFFVLPYVFQLLKPEYLPALDSFKIMSVGSICVYNAILRSSHFTLNNQGKILMQTQIITVFINIALNYWFINLWGMNGAALATAISQVISLLISNIFYKDARFVFMAQLKAFNPYYIFMK